MNKKIYLLTHKVTGAKVRSTEGYLNYWLARGFEVNEIVEGEDLLESD